MDHAGYMTLAVEIWQQLAESGASMPTHLFLQAGVGSFAGSIMGYFIEKMQQQAPTIIIVEPHKANCLFRSATINDGLPHSVGGDMSTLMAGLACGEPNITSGQCSATMPPVLFPPTIVWRPTACACWPLRDQVLTNLLSPGNPALLAQECFMR